MVNIKRLGVVLSPEGGEKSKFAKFNAGMVLDGDIVHMLYRWSENKEQGSYDISKESNYAQDYISYARLSPTGELLYDADAKGAILPSLPEDSTGCQDPRIVRFEGAYYIFYCAWDRNTAAPGTDKCRAAVARTLDFISYEKLGVIDQFTWDKDAYIFPERINGKIAYVHRIVPDVQIDYFDSFEQMLAPESWAGYENRVKQQTVLKAEFDWECGKVGGSVPPIKTEKGWIFIYHGVESKGDDSWEMKHEFIYHAGVALLDLNNPSKVIARLPYPLMSPEEEYELHGDIDNVVFPVGGYIHNGDLYISYGAADKYVAMAKVSVNELLEELAKYPVR